MATRGTPIGQRISGLESAIAAARGKLDETLLDEVEATASRAAGRLRLSATHTVVAIAGATGSGKSSTFNALTGLELSSTGVRRPTTSWATACVWGSEGAEEVLQWLGIPPRHQTMRESMLDTRHDDRALDGVVLMDLPDHDSTELAHHLEVDRLVELADLLVWVLDPQKYADAAIHDRYFVPFTAHQDVMLVVLNHIDTIAEDRRQAMVDDVRRLLAADGLPDVKVLAVSAKTGIGMDELRAELVRRVEAKKATTARAEADLRAAAERLEQAGGAGRTRELPAQRVRELEDAVAGAAGVPTTVAAVERDVRRRASRATTWPPLALFGGRRDPELTLDGRPKVSWVQRSTVDTETRALVDEATEGLTPAWADGVRRAGTERLDQLSDRIDAGLGKVDLGSERLPAWVGLLRGVQWSLLLAAVVAGLWWANVELDLVQLDGELGSPTEVAGFPLPAVVLAGALVLGLVLAVVGRLLAGSLARSRAEQADDRLREVVTAAVAAEVVTPTSEALASYTTFRNGIASAVR
nr:GTPase [Nocardioides thalensis]